MTQRTTLSSRSVWLYGRGRVSRPRSATARVCCTPPVSSTRAGPNNGLFLQIVDEPADPKPVPEADYSFGDLIRAQALGDALALRERGRRVLRVNLGSRRDEGLSELLGIVREG